MRFAILSFCLMLLIACGENKKTENPKEETPVAKQAEAPLPEFEYPVVYKNWEIGKMENLALILKMYKAWDGKSVADMEALMADSMTMDLPKGNRVANVKEQVVKVLVGERENYTSAKNDIIAAYPLHNKDNDEEWVNILVYNKWTTKENKRDSMLFQDLWKLKDGKIRRLISLELTPSRSSANRLEQLTNK